MPGFFSLSTGVLPPPLSHPAHPAGLFQPGPAIPLSEFWEPSQRSLSDAACVWRLLRFFRFEFVLP